MQTQPHVEMDDLAFRFFREFARFEFALKSAGYHYDDGDVRPNWDEFGRSPHVVSCFNMQHTGDLGAAIRYLMEQPPKKQVVIEGKLRWKKCPAVGKVSDQLCTYIRRIRNNLFHGGKFNQDWFDPQRSEQVMRHGLSVLQAFFDASPEVAKAYRE